MPSGVKKRKAARKKKEREAKINSSRDEDFKSQNGRSFESREVNPIYDHPACHNSDKEKLEKNDASYVLSTVDEDISLDIERIQEVGLDGNGVVEDENELISAQNNAGQSINIEYIKSGEKFDERDDENSSNSSADCSIVDKKAEAYTSSYNTNVFDDEADKSSFAAIGLSESTPVGQNINSLVETTLVSDSVKSEVTVSTEKICLMEVAAAENSVVSDSVTSGLKEDADTLLSNLRDGTEASSFNNLNSLPKQNEDKVLPVSMENNQKSSRMMEKGSKYMEDKMFLSSVAPPVCASKYDAIAMEFETPICFKNQKTSASVPIVARRTSLLSCCGLFDLLKGSN
ncbi:uncharacterized protein LOC111010624 isoform X2 [Momordica charantia]|uniref:Uncharacterized protein LOC111010624 isoform X2 n=1 Tax=Momordica charantia TaxID=3673 RepID=A0A6J1CDA8_MOMCH|nr:uncharacterized protein LOC111010624 isoform X2 [Momordica charantia]